MCFMYLCLCVYHVCMVLCRPEEDVRRFLRVGGTGSCELPGWVLGSKLVSSEDPEMLLTAEPYLQPLPCVVEMGSQYGLSSSRWSRSPTRD